MPKTEILSESRTNTLRFQVQSISVGYNFPQCKPNSLGHFSWKDFFLANAYLYNDWLREMQRRSKQKLPIIDGNKSLVHCKKRQLLDVLPNCINASKIFKSGTIPAFALARFQLSTFKHYYIRKIILQEKRCLWKTTTKVLLLQSLFPLKTKRFSITVTGQNISALQGQVGSLQHARCIFLLFTTRGVQWNNFILVHTDKPVWISAQQTLSCCGNT